MMDISGDKTEISFKSFVQIGFMVPKYFYLNLLLSHSFKLHKNQLKYVNSFQNFNLAFHIKTCNSSDKNHNFLQQYFINANDITFHENLFKQSGVLHVHR
jgi:hypothetical protein